MKKLERELSLRSDEIEKLNIEKDESLEVMFLKYFFTSSLWMF